MGFEIGVCGAADTCFSVRPADFPFHLFVFLFSASKRIAAALRHATSLRKTLGFVWICYF